MLTFVVIMFGVCWLPSHVYFLLSDFTNLIDQLGPDNSRIAYGVCHWIAMSNSFVNPIIYLLMSKSFKDPTWTVSQNTIKIHLSSSSARDSG
ncbi:hypothetical protein T265_13504 [Opisthorchis viverrini]|uniref:G-protein coupled receptors family 1 profile domain-containing protein n=1 Tax=Opisthorchis viverrini TaxID=6198 RepID=A0A074ZSN5_OPIVI|nr:hypothetical protein T265_13504 [Opisthorchis viverrini]KER28842.1 hypothetical protein T265_13504 [Opisthorchis viverrini]